MKLFIYLFFLLQVGPLVAQDTWAFIGLNNDIQDESVGDVIPVVNSETGYTALFFKVKRSYVCYLLDDHQKLIKTLKIESLPKNFNVLAGTAYNEQKFTLYFSNDSKSKHGCLSVDFDKNDYRFVEELDIDLKRERLVSYVENVDKFYALSVVKNTSILNLYSFNMDGTIHSKQYDLSNETFKTDNALPLTLDALMFGKNSNGTVETIDTSIPNTLETTAALTKIYITDNGLKISNNTFQKFTYLIQLDLDGTAATLKKIENMNFEKRNLRSNSNSFVFNSMFFDTYSDTDDLIFNVYDLETNNLIKKFHIKAGDSIPFKNSPIIHEVVNSNSFRDLEKTSRFIRKVNTSNIGISVYPYKNYYILTLGASEKIASGEMIIIGGVLGGLVGAAIFSAFESYNKTQSTRIECIFDKQFNHVEGDIPKNGFDLIQDFRKEKNQKAAKLQTVFRYKDAYIWGSYNQAGKYYGFYKFSPN